VKSLFAEPGTGKTSGMAGAVESAAATAKIGEVGEKTLSVGHGGIVPSTSRSVAASIKMVIFSSGK
jgi:hypothetical protein